jgi:hypothetical protein
MLQLRDAFHWPSHVLAERSRLMHPFGEVGASGFPWRWPERPAQRARHHTPITECRLKPVGRGWSNLWSLGSRTGGPGSHARSSNSIRKAHLCELHHSSCLQSPIGAHLTCGFNVRCWGKNRRSLASHLRQFLTLNGLHGFFRVECRGESDICRTQAVAPLARASSRYHASRNSRNMLPRLSSEDRSKIELCAWRRS